MRFLMRISNNSVYLHNKLQHHNLIAYTNDSYQNSKSISEMR